MHSFTAVSHHSTSMSTVVGLFDKASLLGWAVLVDQIGTVLLACVLRSYN